MTGSTHHRVLNSFFIACLVALILLAAAALKWIYPPHRDPLFYGVIGGLEALLAVSLLIYYRSWRVWVVLSLVVSSWMGYSLNVTIFGLPCSCMGSELTLPRGMSLILNGVMFFGAWRVLARQQTHPVRFKRLIWFCSFFLIIGFLFSVIYYNN